MYVYVCLFICICLIQLYINISKLLWKKYIVYIEKRHMLFYSMCGIKHVMANIYHKSLTMKQNIAVVILILINYIVKNNRGGRIKKIYM